MRQTITLPRAALLLHLFYCAVISLPAISAEGLTLENYFAAALQRSETTAIQQEQVHQAEEHYSQANSALLPTVNAIGTYTRQDPLPPSSPQTPGNLSDQRVSRIAATQPLFRGMREYAALRQTRDLLSAQQQDYRHARVVLFTDVVQNFYAILALESDLANYSEEIRLNQERATDIRARVRIGRSRSSELLNVESTISTLRAQIEQLRGQVQVAREAFAFQSGLEAKTPLNDTTTLPEQLEPLENFLAGIAHRPDIHAAQQRLDASTEAISIARGAHLPTLDLNANYYLQRPGYLNDSKWDVQLALTIPLYAGGSIQSKVREAGSQRNQAELTQSQLLRHADQEVRAYYQSSAADLSQLQALENATAAAKKSYEAQLREYRLGLVTNLDVLQALTTYQQNQRAMDRARLTTKSDYLHLLAAAARLPATDATP